MLETWGRMTAEFEYNDGYLGVNKQLFSIEIAEYLDLTKHRYTWSKKDHCI